MEVARPDSPFCGRDDECRRLSTITSVEDEHFKGAVVAGSSGLGKTHLLKAAAVDAHRNGSVVLWGSCLDVGDSWPLHPLREAAQQIKDQYSNLASTARLIDTLEGRLVNEVKADIVAAAHIELTKLSRSHRLTLIIDDLQWVDSSTMRLIRTLLSGLTPSSISFLGGLRTDVDDQSTYDRLLVEFHSSPVVDVLELQPLDKQSTLEVARLLSNRPVSNRRSDRLWKRSGGVPILIRALATEDDAGPDKLRSIRVVLASRINKLHAEARDLVRVVSLSVGPIDHKLARAVLGLDDDELVAAARQAVAEGIIVSIGTSYAPIHGLFAEIAQSELMEAERTLWHRRIAEAIESGLRQDDPDPIELAHHWAGAKNGERALPSLIKAAGEATNQGAAVESWEHWQDVIHILEDPPDGVDTSQLLSEAAEAAYVAEEYLMSLELSLRAEQLGVDPHQNSTIRFNRSRYLVGGGQLEEAESICGQIFTAASTSTDLALEAGAQSADLLTRLGRYEAAIVRATETIARSANSSNTEAAELLATAALGYSKACIGYPELARRSLSQALDGAARHGRPELIEAASRHYVDLLMGPLNELEEGVSLAKQQAQLLVEYGADQRFTTSLLATATTGLFRLGRWRDARRAATAALESDPTGAGVIDLLLGRVRVVIGLGDFDAAEQDLRTVASLLGSDPNPRHDLPFWTLQAGLAMWRQNIELARTHVRSAFDRVGADQVDDPWLLAPLIWHGLRVEALATTPNIDWAFELFTTMTGIRDEIKTEAAGQQNQLEAYFLLCAAELDLILEISRPNIWSKAAEIWDQCGHPYPAAYARMHQADAMFSERTRNSKATAILKTANQLANDLGAQPLVSRIRDLAARARIDLDNPNHPEAEPPQATALLSNSKPAESKLSELTAREHEIIAEVAQGLSNREIGERLFISGRTVGVHVSNILTKLGAKSRVEATAIFIRQASGSAG